jgi:2-dehydropantoate 2-reductase
MTASRIVVIGIGAIGGWVASRLARAGHEVSALARDATLAALKSDGLHLSEDGQDHVCRIAASDDARDLGPQDIIVITVKGHALAAIAPHVRTFLTANTIVVPMMNGVPWWFFANSKRPLALSSVDPGEAIARAIPSDRVIGCVVHASSSLSGPARVRHGVGRKLILGEAKGGSSERLDGLAALMCEAGFDAQTSTHIQQDVWYKLWGNMTMNPISALTGATGDVILNDALVRGLILAAMAEAKEVGRRIGCPIAESGEDRMEVTKKLGVFKTSMLQDAEAGRELEIGALLEAPREIAQQVGVATPSIDALLGLIRVYARARK